ALSKAEKIENYYGFAEPISGKNLAANGKAQAARLGAAFVQDEAVSLAPADNGFTIGAAGNVEIHSRAIILAAGSPRKTPNIPGLSALEGHGVSYCAVCDAFFYRKKAVAVLGFGEYAKAEALHLLPLAGSVALLTNGEEPGANFPPEVMVVTTPVKELLGEKRLEGVRFTQRDNLSLDGVFVAYGAAGSADLARKIGALTQGSAIIADAHGQTNIPGLYAAGDCVGGTLQIAKAVYDGMNAGLSVVKYLRGSND
ncbi:MAG: FAD-dependent oxidoreductase, partial [Oscillospiraceae bacterium]|nr:FAD-dependent oxidoreductase [Oscillospiraceae bacterium]